MRMRRLLRRRRTCSWLLRRFMHLHLWHHVVPVASIVRLAPQACNRITPLRRMPARAASPAVASRPRGCSPRLLCLRYPLMAVLRRTRASQWLRGVAHCWLSFITPSAAVQIAQRVLLLCCCGM